MQMSCLAPATVKIPLGFKTVSEIQAETGLSYDGTATLLREWVLAGKAERQKIIGGLVRGFALDTADLLRSAS
jgi:hypothetical protein